jgi:hypothetical protein
MNPLEKEVYKLFLKNIGTSVIKEFCVKYSLQLSAGVLLMLAILIAQC